MHRLLYVSEAHLAHSDDDQSHAEVQALNHQFSEANTAAGLSGALIYIERQFIQVLEGRLEALEHLFERICCDFRHTNVRLIDLVPAEERLFRDWGMACLAVGESSPINLRDELHQVNFLVGVNGRQAIDQIRSLLDRYGGRQSFDDASGASRLAEAFTG